MPRTTSRAAGARLKLVPLIVTGAMLLTSCGSQAKQSPQGQSAHEPFAVADVRTGMSPAEAEATLKAKGFEVREQTTSDTFGGALAYARYAATRTLQTGSHGTAITSIHGKKGDETVDVGLKDLEPGPVVQDVTYHAPLGAKTFAGIQADLAKRYGPSVDDNPGRTTNWCPTTAGSACPLSKPSLRLEVIGNRVEIRLLDGGYAETRQQGEVKAAMAKGASTKSSY